MSNDDEKRNAGEPCDDWMAGEFQSDLDEKICQHCGHGESRHAKKKKKKKAKRSRKVANKKTKKRAPDLSVNIDDEPIGTVKRVIHKDGRATLAVDIGVIDSEPRNDPKMSLAMRILWARDRVVRLGKDTTVGYGTYSYKAITHDKVTAFLRPKLNQAGILVTMSCEQHESVETGAVNDKGRKIVQFRATYCVTFANVHNTLDKIALRIPSYADDTGDKAPGKAASYAMKYALLKTFMIETGEDDEDRIDGEAPPADTGRAKVIKDDPNVQADVFALADELYGDDAEKKLKSMAKRRFFVDSYLDIPFDRRDDIFRALRSNYAREQQETKK